MRETVSVIWTAATRRSARSLFGLALLGITVWLLSGLSAPSMATTTTVSVTQGSLSLVASPGAQAGSPVTLTESGEVGVPSTLDVLAQLGRPCAATAVQEAAGGAVTVDQRVISATSMPFSLTSQFTPATAGMYYICGYLDGSAGGTEESQSSSSVVVVAPAPPPPTPPPAASGLPGPAPTSGKSCTVPALARHSLAGAKHLLAVAGCSLGVVLQPSARGVRAARSKPGGKSLVLVVGSQRPAAGTTLRANQYEAIRLVLGRPPGTKSKATAKPA